MYFFLNKRTKQTNLSPFHTDSPVRSHASRTLEAGAARNREIMKPVRTLVLVSKRLNCLWIEIYNQNNP